MMMFIESLVVIVDFVTVVVFDNTQRFVVVALTTLSALLMLLMLLLLLLILLVLLVLI